MDLTISVIIRTKNESKYLAKVLTRLKEQQYGGHVEIVVVDSGSTDTTLKIAEDFGCKIIKIKPDDFSFGCALNQGIENATGEIIINISGHSVPVNTNYFDLMVEPFTDDNLAATYGRDIPWPDACPSQARDIFNHFPDSELDGNKFSNANAAIRRRCWETIKFDEKISASEDLLWAKQIMTFGYKIQYIPRATAFHSHSSSLRYIYRRALIESKSINAFVEVRRAFGISSLIRFTFIHILMDYLFVFKKGYKPHWFLHIPFYRLFQGVGLLKGFNTHDRECANYLAIGQYSFDHKTKKKNNKIILVTHCFFPESVGGTEYYTLNLAKNLIKEGWEVKIVSAIRDLTQKRYKVIESKYDNIDVIKINNPSELCTKFAEYFIDHTVDDIFCKILQAERPDLIHFQHTAYLSARLPEVADQLGVPSVFTIHDYWFMCFRSQLIRPAEGICPGPSDGLYCATCYDVMNPSVAGIPRFPILTKMLQAPFIRQTDIKSRLSYEMKQKIKKLLYKKPDATATDRKFLSPETWNILEHSFRIRFMRRQLSFPAVVISPSLHLKKRHEKEGFREITYIPHGFELADHVNRLRYEGKLVIAYLSNIIPFKGADVVLRDLKCINKRGNIKILFYGKVLDYSYQKQLEDMAKEYPEVEILFMGPYKGKNELEKILAGTHLVVFPSLWEENHPLTIKEALMYGVPVISSSLGGAPEAIVDGINGLIFNPYTEGDFAEKINLIIDNPGLLERISDGARKTKIESMEEHVEKVIAAYNTAVGTSNKQMFEADTVEMK